MMWPYYLGMTGIVVCVAGFICNAFVGFQPWGQSVLWIGMALSFLSLLAMQQEREQSRRRELDELRSEIQALREGR